MAVSTKSGDNKATTTGSGQRISKASKRVYLMGTADELCAIIGVARSQATHKEITAPLLRIQNMLFILIAQLADPLKLKIKRPLEKRDLDWLESLGEGIESTLPKIDYFIVYGENPTSAHLDHARAVARRLERDAIAASDEIKPDQLMRGILNRLSDTLYLLARKNDILERSPLTAVSYK